MLRRLMTFDARTPQAFCLPVRVLRSSTRSVKLMLCKVLLVVVFAQAMYLCAQPSFAAEAAIDPDNLIVPGTSVGKLRLGMTKAEVIAHLGKPSERRERLYTYWSPDRKNLLKVLFSGDKAKAIVFNSGRFATASGASLGNFKDSEHKDEFGPSSHDLVDNYSIFPLKESGFAIFAPLPGKVVVPSGPLGVIHDPGQTPNTVLWLPGAPEIEPSTKKKSAVSKRTENKGKKKTCT